MRQTKKQLLADIDKGLEGLRVYVATLEHLAAKANTMRFYCLLIDAAPPNVLKDFDEAAVAVTTAGKAMAAGE